MAPQWASTAQDKAKSVTDTIEEIKKKFKKQTNQPAAKNLFEQDARKVQNKVNYVTTGLFEQLNDLEKAKLVDRGFVDHKAENPEEKREVEVIKRKETLIHAVFEQAPKTERDNDEEDSLVPAGPQYSLLQKAGMFARAWRLDSCSSHWVLEGLALRTGVRPVFVAVFFFALLLLSLASLHLVRQLLQAVLLFLYPVYKSTQAMEATDMSEVKRWFSYWILVAFFFGCEAQLGLIQVFVPIWPLFSTFYFLLVVLPDRHAPERIYLKIFKPLYQSCQPSLSKFFAAVDKRIHFMENQDDFPVEENISLFS
jgi:hypothetical protein